MPDLAEPSGQAVGFVGLVTGEVPDLIVVNPWTLRDSAARESDQPLTEPSGHGTREPVVHLGTMRSLEELLSRSKVSVVFLERSRPGSPDSRPSGRTGAAASDFIGRVADAVRGELDSLAERYAEVGRSLEALGTPTQLAQQMTSGLPSPSGWDRVLGPFLTEEALASRLGVTTAGIPDMRERREVFGLLTRDGRWVYPSFQMTDAGRVVGGLTQLLRIIGDSVDGWTLAGWLMAKNELLHGMSPLGALDSIHSARVLALARDAAARWTT